MSRLDTGRSYWLRSKDLRSFSLDGSPTGSLPLRESEPQTTEVPQEPTADRRLLSVLFCDLVGSTALSAQLDPEDMHELTRRYQDSVAGAITRFGGYVAKYLGDGVLAYFGWPMAYEDHAERSIRAGLQALAAVEDFQSPQRRAIAGAYRHRIGARGRRRHCRQQRDRTRLDRRGHAQSRSSPAKRCRAWPDCGGRQHAPACRAVIRNREPRYAGVERL